MKYVIIGNGPAAVGAVEGIRSVDQDGGITLVSAEARHTYSRPLISYYLEGKTDLARIKYRPDDFYEKNGVRALFGVKATGIDSAAKTVAVDTGEVLPYDKLLVATGSSPSVPPFAGLDTVKKRFTFMTLDDALALEQEVTNQTDVLIIGAGLIGLKCAEGIADRARSVTVADISASILPSILDAQCAAMVQKKLEAHGVRFILGHGAKEFSPGAANFDNGQSIPFDLLVIAVGVRPNISLLADIGAAHGRGIEADSHMRTSLSDIYCAGDCAQSHDITTDEDKILALWGNAYMQGECAGVNMAGGDKEFTHAIAMNAIGFFGLHMASAGSRIGDELTFESQEGLKKLYVRDNRLMGYVMVGDIRKAGIYTSLIREMTPLDTIDFELIAREPSLMAFSRRDRARKLGGPV